jgi:hypothetical protein
MRFQKSTSPEFGLFDLLLFVLAHAGMHSSGRISTMGSHEFPIPSPAQGQSRQIYQESIEIQAL